MIIAVILISLFMGLYPQTMVVTEIDFDTDVVMCQDFNGNEWKFEGVEDWCEGDIVSAIMYGNETPEIYDDEIVMARYNGNIAG